MIELLTLDDSGFNAKFAATPISRTKRRGLLRNVCVALGNVGTEEHLPHLERFAAGADELLREHAEWALARVRERERMR